MVRYTRRDLVRRTSVLSVAALAGCSGLTNDDADGTETPTYDHLTETSVYVSDDVGIRLPDDVTRTSSAETAAVVVLHANPSIDAEQAVSWLADGRVIALLGDRAQETWVDWTRSDAYAAEFGSEAGSVAEPAPHLLVAAMVDSRVTTSRFTWGDQPSNQEVLEALEEALGDAATPTPS